MTDMTKEEAVKFFAEFYGGEHHIPGDVRENDNGWWGVAHYGELASYDYNYLTRLVLLAHDRCIRVSVHGCNGDHVRISIWNRDPAEECIMSGHPTIEEALSKWRKNNPAREKPEKIQPLDDVMEAKSVTFEGLADEAHIIADFEEVKEGEIEP